MLNALIVAAAIQTMIFSDDFEGSLAKWHLTQPAFVSIVDAGQHSVLIEVRGALYAGGALFAVFRSRE